MGTAQRRNAGRTDADECEEPQSHNGKGNNGVIMGTTITVESTIDYRYLMNKSKNDLARMYLDLLREYEKELTRNTPRPTYGIKVVLDTSLPSNVCEVRDEQGRRLGKVEF